MAKCDKSVFFIEKLISVFHSQGLNENLYMIMKHLKNQSKYSVYKQYKYIKSFMAKCDKSGFFIEKLISVFHSQGLNENLYMIMKHLKNQSKY